MPHTENYPRTHETLAHEAFGRFAESGTLMVFGDATTNHDGSLSRAYGDTVGLGIVVTRPGAKLSIEGVAAAAKGGELFDGPVLVQAGSETYATDGTLLVKLPPKRAGDVQKGAFGKLGDHLEVAKFKNGTQGTLPATVLEAGKPWKPLIATGNTAPVTAVVLPGSATFAIRKSHIGGDRNSFGLKGPEPVCRPDDVHSPMPQAKAHFERAKRLLASPEHGRVSPGVAKGLGELSIKAQSTQEGTAFAQKLLAGASESQTSLLKAMVAKSSAVKPVRHGLGWKVASAVETDIRPTDIDRMIKQYQADPKDVLAWGREVLFSIGRTDSLSPGEKKAQVRRYLEDYLGLTTELDHVAFPPTKPGEVRAGVPSYVPDGFNDLGREQTLTLSHRDREMIHVDKKAIFAKYRPVLEKMFMHDYSSMTHGRKKMSMATYLARSVYYGMPYDYKDKVAPGSKVDLAGMNEGVCRHQALVFQVLAQVAGLKSELLKSELVWEGKTLGKHSSNLLRINSEWFSIDVTNPDVEIENGERVWRPGIIPLRKVPTKDSATLYEGKLKHSGIRVGYRAHNRMYWTID